MRFPFLLALAISASEAGAPDARAEQTSEVAPQSVALGLGHQGLRKFSEGDFVGARDDFEAAERLAHSPVFLLYQARSELHLGHLRRARDLLTSCARESIVPSTPEAWRNAVREAALDLKAVSDSIPSVRLVVVGSVKFPVDVRLGKDEFTLSERETIRDADPGGSELLVKDARGTTIGTQIFLEAGEKAKRMVLSFPSIGKGAAASDAVRARRVVEAPLPLVPPRPHRSGAHAAFLLGGSALMFSAVATTIAVTKARAVKKHCSGQSCRPEDQAVAESALQWANLATAGVVVGTAGVVTGVGLLFYPAPGSLEISYRARF